MIAKCKCNHCPAYLEFDSANVGQVTTCPTCGMETTLFIQKTIQPEALLSQNELETIDSLSTVGGTDCPSCGSTQTQRLKMAFTSGISQNQGTVIGIDLDGDIGGGRYGGTTQTALSISSKPPKEKPVLVFYFGGLVVTLILLVVIFVRNATIENSETGSIGTIGKCFGFIFFIGAMVIAHKLAGPNLKFNAQIYPRLVNRWLAAWICLRCGKRWIPEK